MKALLAMDAHLTVYEGKVYAPSQLYSIIENYFLSFGRVSVLSRAFYEKPSGDMKDIDGYIRDFYPVASLSGVLTGKYTKQIRRAVSENDLLVCRCASFIGNIASKTAVKEKKPVFVVVHQTFRSCRMAFRHFFTTALRVSLRHRICIFPHAVR